MAREVRCVRCVCIADGAWQCMEHMFNSQKLWVACVGKCQVLSGCSWLGFAWDCLFYHSIPLFWQFDEQYDEIRELQGLWA